MFCELWNLFEAFSVEFRATRVLAVRFRYRKGGINGRSTSIHKVSKIPF